MKSKSKKKSKTGSDLLYIKPVDDANRKISESDIETYRCIDYPLFSFKWFDGSNLNTATDIKFFVRNLERFKALSELGWNKIRTSGKHAYGMEPLPKNQIKKALPQIITPDVKELHVLRATGDNHAMIGLQENKIFHILFIESQFNTIYKH